jgi:glycosyltransferase involved in cell wall biosynthesis
MAKDLVLDRYGRFYSIPKAMAAKGDDIHLHTLSYRSLLGATGQQQRNAEDLNLTLKDHGIASLVSQTYLLSLLTDCRRFRPDVVIGASDVPHLVFARLLARVMSIPFIADLYDQFFAYGLTKLPLVGQVYKATLLSADGVTCVSNPLAEWVRDLGVSAERVVVVGNAVEERFIGFEPGHAKRQHREKFGLPTDGVLVGTAGALTEDRDIKTLYGAHEILISRGERIYLVVAGPRSTEFPVPRAAKVIDLGELPHERIPAFLSALDVGVVCNRDSLFARNCFPQKYLEMRAVNLPVVAAGVGDILGYGRSDNTWHYTPGDSTALASAIVTALVGFDPARTTLIPTWGLQANRMLSTAKRAVAQRRENS